MERKSAALQEELEATHVDYKGELSLLARKIRDEITVSDDQADQVSLLLTRLSW